MEALEGDRILAQPVSGMASPIPAGVTMPEGVLDNWECLGCSPVRDVLDSWGGQYQRAPVIELDADPLIQELLALCRPTQQFDTEEQFEALWSWAGRVARALSAKME
jgi:hypothetical protein